MKNTSPPILKNFSSHSNLSITPPPYFYQFLLPLIFINSSSPLFLSIPSPPYFYQFLFPLKFINSSSSLFLSIPPPTQIYQFLLPPKFINSSSSLFLSIPPPPYFYQFLLLLIFINSSSPFFSSIPQRCIISRYTPRYIVKWDVIKIESNDFHCIGIGIGHENGIFDQILASNLVSNGDKGSVQPLSEALTAGYLRGCKREEGERYTKREKLPDARHPNDSVPESISSYELVGCGPISHP